MDYNLIKRIVALVERSDIHELEVESEGVRIKVNKNAPAQVAPMSRILVQENASFAHTMPTTTLAGTPKDPMAAAGQAADSGQKPLANALTVNSPMVGTFYRAPSPESPPFVKIGDAVGPETVVCILEAMKVMNELKAELSGRVVEIMVENGQPVEFGQPLFRLEP